MAKSRGRPRYDDVLTPAEWRTVHFIRHGLTNSQIARRFGVTVDAVKYHVANAVAKLGLRNRKALKHWAGVPRTSPLHAMGNDMNDKMHSLGLGQVSRTVSDVARAESWYRDTLGLDWLYTFDKLAFFDCGGTRLMLTQADEPAADSVLYFRVPDILAAYEALQARGVEFINAPHMIHRHEDGTEEWMAFFNDPDGRPLGIMSAVHA